MTIPGTEKERQGVKMQKQSTQGYMFPSLTQPFQHWGNDPVDGRSSSISLLITQPLKKKKLYKMFNFTTNDIFEKSYKIDQNPKRFRI